MRMCDECGEVRAQGATWYFVTDGKADISEWRNAAHWCPVCMETAVEYLKELRS